MTLQFTQVCRGPSRVRKSALGKGYPIKFKGIYLKALVKMRGADEIIGRNIIGKKRKMPRMELCRGLNV